MYHTGCRGTPKCVNGKANRAGPSPGGTPCQGTRSPKATACPGQEGARAGRLAAGKGPAGGGTGRPATAEEEGRQGPECKTPIVVWSIYSIKLFLIVMIRILAFSVTVLSFLPPGSEQSDQKAEW